MTSNTPSLADLIPDYAEGSLDAETLILFEKRLATDTELQQELREFLAFRELYREAQQEPAQPSDAVFRRIVTVIDEHEHVRNLHAREPQPEPSSLSSQLLATWQLLTSSFTLPWGLAAAQAVLIVALLLPGDPQNTTTYHTLGEKSAADTQYHAPSFNIVFIDSAREADIRALLVSVRASIISGPSLEGRYIITVPSDGDLEQLTGVLRQADIVRFLEETY